PELGAVSCHQEIVDERSGRRAVFRGPVSYPLRALHWANFPGSCSFMVIRRSSFEAGLLFDEALPGCQDWDLWLRLAERSRVATAPHVLCRYVFHGPTQITNSVKVPAHEAFLAKHAPTM